MTHPFVLGALALNLLILVPVVGALLGGRMPPEGPFGPQTPALLILTCIYAAILLVSVLLIVLHVMGHPWALPMTVALFAVQITYKLGTVALVGLGNPIVITNLGVVVVQLAVLVHLFATR